MMVDEEEGAPAEQQQSPLGPSSSGPPASQGAAEPAQSTEERGEDSPAARNHRGLVSVDSCLDQFKLRKFFVLRVNISTSAAGVCKQI